MKIYILMPTYNDSSTIAYSLDSILSQNYKNYEIIIVDDGSTDDTKKVINNYKKKYDKDNKITKKERKTFNGDKSSIDKNGYDHFMIKEINEEPEVIKKTLNSILDNNKINLDKYFKKNYKNS